MKSRTILTTFLALGIVAACGERGEPAEGPEAAGAATEGAEATMEIPEGLRALAQVTVEEARTTALARVPGGRVRAGELEEEDGRLIYSFDIGVDGLEGLEEIHVDARSGEVVSQEHEGAEEEAAEAAEEGRG